MAADCAFTEDDMAVDEGLGYPKAYAKICRDRSASGVGLYSHGPPFCFTPYPLQEDEVSKKQKKNLVGWVESEGKFRKLETAIWVWFVFELLIERK